MKLCLKIWWAQFWSTIPLTLLGGIAAGIVFGIVQRVIGLDFHPAVSGVAGGVIGLFIAIKVIERLMTKGFGEYRLAVVRK